MVKMLVLALAVLTIAVGIWYMLLSKPLPFPTLDPDVWWGPNELKTKNDVSIRPFKIKFEEDMITDLKSRLKNHRPFVPPLEGVGFEYGFNSACIESWLKYWVEEYSFAEREKFLNKFSQFKTNIKGLDIHFIRVRPQQVSAGIQIVPLLLMHGWPGSIREFYEAIPFLTTQRPGYNFVFEVVVPSLPGYGFSDAAVRPGLAIPYVGDIFRVLMQRLGHNKFYIQGGDWGAGIASAMATLFPDVILGLHSNMIAATPSSMIKTIIGAYIPSLIVESHLADRMYPLSSYFAYILEESGYFHLQATKPDTVGVSLTDSPSGLLAYILEKFGVWTRKDHKFKADGGLEYRFSKEKLIDNLMIYWSTNSITTSMRFYAENLSRNSRKFNLESHQTPVPTWAFQAKHEVMYQPPSILKKKFPNLINTTTYEDGGHFLALELPEIFVEDVFKAVKAFKEWHKENTKTEL